MQCQNGGVRLKEEKDKGGNQGGKDESDKVQISLCILDLSKLLGWKGWVKKKKEEEEGLKEDMGKEEMVKEEGEGGNAIQLSIFEKTSHLIPRVLDLACWTSRVGPRVLYLACPAMLSPLFNEITLLIC